MAKIYLTIDDGPSEKFTSMIDFLAERKIPAVFFNRGDFMEARPDAVIYGIKRGYIMANHTYSHKRAAEMSVEEECADIARADKILGDLYKRADTKRPEKYFRFPYLDRGMGAYFAEGEVKPEFEAAHFELLGAGLGHKPAVPGMCHIDKKRKLQEFLKAQGFAKLPVKNVTLPWYAQTEMAQATDSLCTYSTSDWALLERHKGKHGFETVQDLKDKIDRDAWLQDDTSNHIVLAHEQAEIYDVTTALVDHFLARGDTFLNF